MKRNSAYFYQEKDVDDGDAAEMILRRR